MKNVLVELNKDQEIQNMRYFIYKKTGEWEGLLFWDGETIEEYRKRLRRIVDEIKADD